MKVLLILLTLVVVPISSHADDVPFLVCQRPIIQQALDVTRKIIGETQYVLTPSKNIHKDLKTDKDAVETIESKVFKKKMFNLSYDVVQGASLGLSGRETPTIRIYPDTITELNNLDKPQLAHMFTMAHEMGHLVQAYWQSQDPKKLTPHQLSYQTVDGDDYNIWHSETDCIGVEILYQAGVRDFSAVIPTLDSIRKDCYNFRDHAFCDRAYEIRAKSVQTYLDNNRELTSN